MLEAKVLSAPAVEQALEDFEFVNLDTDKYPAAAKYFQISALPTLVVEDANGVERYRHVGPINIEPWPTQGARTKTMARSEEPATRDVLQ